MKKGIIWTIILMAVATIVSVAVVSCKKDNENALLGNNNETSKSFDMRQIDDMSAYLKNFRQKMLEGKDCETLSLEDAAWHLASLMNYEHCNTNVHFNDVRFDSIYMQVNVTDGVVLMGDLRTAYEQMWPAIQKFQKGLNLNNQNLRFVNMSISDSGKASITMMTTFFSDEKDLGDYLWYFPDIDYLDSICQLYFDEYAIYPWNYGAVRRLNSTINALEGNLYIPDYPQSSAYYPSRSYTFYYNLWVDPYNDPPFFYNNSRLFTYHYQGLGVPNGINISPEEMCYANDSYIGLGFEYLEANPNSLYPNERPVYWLVDPDTIVSSNIICHKLIVQYGCPILVGPGPGGD